MFSLYIEYIPKQERKKKKSVYIYLVSRKSYIKQQKGEKEEEGIENGCGTTLIPSSAE